MLRLLCLLSILAGTFYLAEAKVRAAILSRMLTEVARCGLHRMDPVMREVLAEHEKNMVYKNFSLSDIEAMFDYTDEKIEYWKHKSPFLMKLPVLPGPALETLSSIRRLSSYECDNFCAYALIHNACESGRFLGACHPKYSKKPSLVGALVDSEVYPFVERCYKTLYDKAIATEVDPSLQETVTHMTDTLSRFTMHDRWANEEEMFLKAQEPFLMSGYLFAPLKPGFYNRVLDLMIEMEKKTGEDELRKAYESHTLKLKLAEKKYGQFILEPCLEYMEKFYKVMDPTMEFGHWIEATTPSIFRIPPINDAEKLAYFRILRNFDACAWFVHSDFEEAWLYIVK